MSKKFIETRGLTLKTSIGTSDTQMIIAGAYGLDGEEFSSSDFGDGIYATIEPNTARAESLLLTFVSTSDGDLTVNMTRGLIGKQPYSTGGLTYAHSAGSKVVFTNSAALFNELSVRDRTETISGAKTYTGSNTHQGTEAFTGTLDASSASSVVVPTPTSDTQAARKDYVDDADAQIISDYEAADDLKADDDSVVHDTGDETVAGVKTFSSSPVIPTATGATDAVNKGQMETYIAANSGDIKASDTAFGTVKLDVAPESASNPVAIGVNSPIDSSTADPTPANNEGKLVKLESDGKIHESFVQNVFRATAFENIDADKWVGFNYENKIAEALQDGSFTSMNNKPANFGVETVISIDTNKYIVTYSYSSDQYAVAFEIDDGGESITFGSAVMYRSESSSHAGVCKLDTNKFVTCTFGYGDDDIESRVATVSGLTLSFGAIYTHDSDFAVGGGGFCCQIDTDKFAFAFFCTGTYGATNAGFATVSGTTITVVDNVTTGFTGIPANNDNDVQMVKVATDKVVIAANGYAFVCTTSGSTFSVGSQQIISAETDGFRFLSIENDTLWMTLGGTTYYSTISGQTITIIDSCSGGGELFSDGVDIYAYVAGLSTGYNGIYSIELNDSIIIRKHIGGGEIAFSDKIFYVASYGYIGVTSSAIYHLSKITTEPVGILVYDTLQDEEAVVGIQNKITTSTTLDIGRAYELQPGEAELSVTDNYATTVARRYIAVENNALTSLINT